MTKIIPTPQQLVDQHGQVQFGQFDDSIASINGRHSAYLTAMGKPAGKLRKHFNYKQFQYFGVISDQLLLGCALADTAWLGIAFFYIFEPQTGRLQEYTWHSPLGRALRMSSSPTQGNSHFRQAGIEIEMGYQQSAGRLRKTLTVNLKGINVEATMVEPAQFQPMSLCTRAGVNGWVYANKVAGEPVTGSVTFQGRKQSLARLDAFGHHDFSAGYMRRETFWNWACFSARQGQHRLGLNLSCGVNETSFSENCLWVDGERIAVAGTHFHYDRSNPLGPWQVESQCGQVRLRFEPAGCHREHLNLGLFASNFKQLFGLFSGELKLKDGRQFPIHCQGFVEEQYAKW